MTSLDPDLQPPGPLVWLQGWFAAQCNGDYEHDAGIVIGSLDNPGWQIKIALGGSDMDGRGFDRVKIERAPHDWLHAWTADNSFEAACGPLNLGEAIHLFRTWVQELA